MIEIKDLVNALTKLPGIGKKSATRLSYFIIKNKQIGFELSKVINEVTSGIRFCSVCGNYTTNEICSICEDITRDSTILCIVEEPNDLAAIEETGFFKGQYHILMGNINPLEGRTPESLKINELIKRVDKGDFNEVLIATNPTIEGEATFLYLSNLLGKYNLKKSRIATGIPMGGSLEYSDTFTLGKALQSKLYI